MSRVGKILQNKERRRVTLNSSLNSIINELAKMGALKIILFGSLVKGEVDVYSDLDLLIIMPNSRSGKQWMRLIYGSLSREVASDLIVYNEEEFEEKLPISRFLQSIVNSGRVVYEKTD
ncbi:MAG: nucleotidyltransferase domain-containing protein [Candidatus Jordarchaeum sp.]|uniref:nucleotidyltransferase domain-containing protein n=1 Tax=Candidatus Jordarchaeum sp. TaxID=2823881 RepID=UPI00404B7111